MEGLCGPVLATRSVTLGTCVKDMPRSGGDYWEGVRTQSCGSDSCGVGQKDHVTPSPNLASP